MKKFKKIALLVATAAMVLGATMTVFAGSNEASLPVGSKGYVDCYVYNNGNYASADTSVVSYAHANYISAYAMVDLHVVYQGESYDTSATYSDSETAVGTSAYACADVSSSINGPVAYYYAESSHSADIDGVPASCGLSTR